MLIKGYNEVKLGLTTAHWSLTWMNEQLVPAQKGLTQCYLPVTGPANIHGALNSTVEFRYMEGYLLVHSMVKY